MVVVVVVVVVVTGGRVTCVNGVVGSDGGRIGGGPATDPGSLGGAVGGAIATVGATRRRGCVGVVFLVVVLVVFVCDALEESRGAEPFLPAFAPLDDPVR